MATTVTLPDGNTAILKDNAELTNREVKSLRRAARKATQISNHLKDLGYNEKDEDSWGRAIAELPVEEYDELDIYQRSCVLMRLKSWTLDLPIPETTDAVDDLPRAISVPITVEATKIKFDDDFSIDEGLHDPKAPTEGSGT